MFNIIRSNPRISGYNLTSLLDCIGNAEGVMDVFREYKAGHLPVLQAGWAKLRWCLFVNPMHVYSDRPMRVKVALASEDALPAGVYPATLSIAGPQGVVWKKALSVTVPAGPTPPLAYTVFDEDVVLPKLKAGTWKLSASFDNRENAASSELAFFVSEKSALPKNLGPITVLGVDQPIRDFLTAHGAVLREYAPDQATDREVIVVGTKLPGDTDAATAAAWRSLYGRIARGAHGIFLWQNVFSKDKDRNHWLALAEKGEQTGSGDWLYHKDIVAKPHAMMAGLQTKIMTPDYYADVLSGTDFFYKVTPPDDAVAVAIRASFAPFDYKDGVMLGVYNHHAGKFTINGLNLPRNIGHPAADRLLLNMVEHAKATAAPIQSLLAGYDAELDSLGIRE
jgi:hypothetical protein